MGMNLNFWAMERSNSQLTILGVCHYLHLPFLLSLAMFMWGVGKESVRLKALHVAALSTLGELKEERSLVKMKWLNGLQILFIFILCLP